MEKVITLWHGSANIIEKPIYGYGKMYNDYGLGFYCTESQELAKEWACTEQSDGYANRYRIKLDGLRILNLSDPDYTVLSWLAILVDNRKFQQTAAVARQGIQYLKDNFLPDVERYDVIIGYRADDSYFSFARAFVNNTISVAQLARAMRLGKLGEQIVLKSPAAFAEIQFEGYETADRTRYFLRRKSRNEQARKTYLEQADDLEGLYMRDVIREKVTHDDPRLR